MRYYLMRGKKVVAQFELTRNVKIIIGDTSPDGEEQYLLPEKFLNGKTKEQLANDLAISTTVESLNEKFVYLNPKDASLEIEQVEGVWTDK